MHLDHFTNNFSKYMAENKEFGTIEVGKPICCFAKISSISKFLKKYPTISLYTHRRLCRNEILKHCKNHSNSIQSCFILIMAWGGARVNHFEKSSSFINKNQWLKIEALRTSTKSVSEDYNDLLKLSIPHLGVAFLTKLLYFLRPNNDAYILDQWLAKSVNLLKQDRKFINMTSGGWVNKINSTSYQEYCDYINQLAQHFDIRGDHLEEILFSIGVKTPKAWRNYVKQKY